MRMCQSIFALKAADPKISPDPWSRCGVEGDRVAEGLQFADVVTGFAFGVVAGGVVVRTEVDELGLLVGEQRPDDDQDRSTDRDDGPLLATASGDPSISLAEEGVGAGGPRPH